MAVTRVSRSRKAKQPSAVRAPLCPPDESFASEICWVQDAGLRFIRIGAFAARMSGLPAGAFVGKCRWELPHAGVSEAGWSEHRRVLGSHQPFNEFEYALRGVDGTLTWLSVSGEPCFDADGSFAGYRGIAFDITQRRRKEEAARQGEERLLRELLDALDAPISLTDAEDRIVFVNHAFAAQHPAGAESAVGKRYEQYLRDSIVPNYAPDARGREDEWVAERMARRRSGASSHEQLRPNGVWHLIVDRRLPGGGTITFNLDITERKRTEEALVARNRVLDAILGSIPDAVVFTDGKTGEVLVNGNLYTFFGLDRAAATAHGNPVHYGLRQMALRGEYGPGDPDALVRERISMVERRLAETGGFSYERQLSTGRWIESRLTRIEGGGRLALYRDITSEKQRAAQTEAQALLLNTIFRAMGEGISVFDADLRLRACNARFGELAGIDPALLAPGTSVRDILVAQARAGEFGPCDPHTEAERRIGQLWPRHPILAERVRPDGRVIEVRRNPIPEGGYVTVFVDITERKRTEKALLESQARFETLFRSSPTPAAILRETGGHLECNDAYCAYMGFSREQIIGHYCEDFGVTRNVEERRRAVAAFAAAGRLDGYAMTVYNAAGEGRSVLLYAEHTSWLDGSAVLVQMVDISERIAAEHALKDLNRTLEARVAERTASLVESEARLRNVLDALPHLIYVKDREDRYLLANRASAEFLGQSSETVVGRTFADFARNPGDAAQMADNDARVRAAGGMVVLPAQPITDAAGSTRVFSATCVPMHFSADHPDALLGILVDVTERRAIEQALRETREYLETLIDLMPDALIVHDSGVVRYANREAARMAAAIDDRPLIGSNLLDRFEPEVRAAIAERFDQLYRIGGATSARELRVLLPHGNSLDLESSSALINERGTPRILTVFREITERKLQEKKVVESERRLRQVIDLVPHHVFAKDARNRYLFANVACARAHGLSTEEIVGKNAAEIGMLPEEVELVHAVDARVRETGERVEVPHQRVRGLDGIERIFWNIRMPMNYSTDAPDAVLAVATDVTALKTAQAEVENLNVDLEARVAERTAELMAANAELEAFSYSISHDLRAPVRAVTGFTQHVIGSHGPDLPADVSKLLDRVLASGTRMGVMIDGLLELARVARSTVRRAPVDLAALARDIWGEVAAAEPQRDVSFVAPQGCAAGCDPVLIRNVLQNLLGNAFKYTRRTPAARVEFGVFDEGAGCVYFVRDNGVGFDMAYTDRLFGMFQRLHSAVEFEGTGVGLATVKRIVERHGGRIWAESRPGAGACIRFTLGSEKSNA